MTASVCLLATLALKCQFAMGNFHPEARGLDTVSINMPTCLQYLFGKILTKDPVLLTFVFTQTEKWKIQLRLFPCTMSLSHKY